MSNLDEKQIAKEILIELMRNNLISYDGYPDAKSSADLSCLMYKQILKTISESE